MMDALRAPSVGIPPSPWIVRGSALIIVGRLSRQRARELAGAPRGLVTLPGLGSLAALSFIRYDATPVGPYHEVAVSPGVLWRTLPGGLVSQMLVDSARSQLAGRALWGLPKELAQFDWQPEQVTALDQSGQELLAVRWQAKGVPGGLPAPPLPVATLRGPRRQLFAVNGWLLGVRRARVTLTIPAESPFAPLAGLARGPHLALAVDHFRLRISDAVDLL